MPVKAPCPLLPTTSRSARLAACTRTRAGCPSITLWRTSSPDWVPNSRSEDLGQGCFCLSLRVEVIGPGRGPAEGGGELPGRNHLQRRVGQLGLGHGPTQCFDRRVRAVYSHDDQAHRTAFVSLPRTDMGSHRPCCDEESEGQRNSRGRGRRACSCGHKNRRDEVAAIVKAEEGNADE